MTQESSFKIHAFGDYYYYCYYYYGHHHYYLIPYNYNVHRHSE